MKYLLAAFAVSLTACILLANLIMGFSIPTDFWSRAYQYGVFTLWIISLITTLWLSLITLAP